MTQVYLVTRHMPVQPPWLWDKRPYQEGDVVTVYALEEE